MLTKKDILINFCLFFKCAFTVQFFFVFVVAMVTLLCKCHNRALTKVLNLFVLRTQVWTLMNKKHN